MEEICGCPAIQATWIMSPSNHDDVPYNINSTQDVSLSSISPAPKLFPEKLNTLTDGLPKQIPHNLPNVNSITVFPYLLKPDKILNFSFRKDANNHSAKMAVYPLAIPNQKILTNLTGQHSLKMSKSIYKTTE